MSPHYTGGEVDMTKPTSLVLRAGTSKIHEEITNGKSATYLLKGEVRREDYVRYLMLFWHIYDTLETGLAANADNDILSPSYNPAVFARAPNISSDISFLLGISDDDSSWKTHPVYQSLVSLPLFPFRAYISRLAYLAEKEPWKLLAHSYIRYMADLGGGQIMKRRIRKIYDLEEERGTMYYDFCVLGREGESIRPRANMGELNKIKEYFRAGLDTGVGDDVELKGALLDEVEKAFRFHSDILDEVLLPGLEAQEPVTV